MKMTMLKPAFLLILTMLLLAGCGHLSGNNPVGTTGGGDSGYGSFGPSSGGGGGDGGGQHDPALFGSWSSDTVDTSYEILTFSANGQFTDELFSNGQLVISLSGEYETSGNQLTMTVGDIPVEVTYDVSGNTLTIMEQGETYIYHKL